MTLISTIVPPPVAGPNTWVDLHFYYNQDTFVALYDRFDNANRSLPIIVGEYACIYEFSNGSPEIGAQVSALSIVYPTSEDPKPMNQCLRTEDFES